MALCLICTTSEDEVDFPTVRELVEHQKGGHKTRPKKELPPPVKPVTPSATELKAMQEKGEQDLLKAGLIKPDKQTQPIIQKPLELQYKWSGVHAGCNTEVKTIEVIVGEALVVVAFCSACNVQLNQQTVIPIEKQLKGKEKKTK